MVGRARAVAARTAVALLCASLLALLTITSVASAADFTWSGAAPVGSSHWSDGTNWAGSPPSNPVGTLDFPRLANSECTQTTPTETCATSDNDITGLDVNALTIDASEGYNVEGNPITLGGGGLASNQGSPSESGLSVLNLPITLSAPQTWTLADRQINDNGGVTGSTEALTINTPSSGQLAVTSDMEVGATSIGGTVVFSDGGELNATDGKTVGVTGSSGYLWADGIGIPAATTLGALSVNGGVLAVGAQGTATELVVDGDTSLSPTATLLTSIKDAGNTAGTDYSHLSVQGNVDLGGAELSLYGANFPSGGGPTCLGLNVGAVETLVSSTGTLTGTFNALPDGTTIPVSCVGGTGTAPTVRINYTAHAVTATVVSATTTTTTSSTTSTSSSVTSSTTNTTMASSSTSTQTNTTTASTATTVSTATTATTATASTSTKRASAVSVVCDFTFADETDVCTATVGDATGQAGEPTGSVSFTSTVPGTSFTGGGHCTLEPQAGDVGVTSCSVSYQGDQTQALQATAAYSGDGTFAPSSGSTQSALPSDGNSVYDPTIQKFNPPTVNAPGTLDATVDIPLNGSTVTAEGEVTADLTEQAVCAVADNQESGPPAGGASAARAKPKAKAKASPGVSARLVKRNVRAGKLKLKLHFSRSALLKAFPRSTRVQILVVVTITPRHGLPLTTFHRETFVLRVSHPHGRAASAADQGDAWAATVTRVDIEWSGTTNCGTLTLSTSLIATDPSPQQAVTVTWTNPKAVCFGGVGGAQGDIVALDNIPANTYNETLSPSGISVYINAANGRGLSLALRGTLVPTKGQNANITGSLTMTDGSTQCKATAPSLLIQTKFAAS